VGGWLVAVALLAAAEFRPGLIDVRGNSANPFWLWTVLPQWDLALPRSTDVERPLLILFFTCIGLNASWGVARLGGRPLAIYLLLAAIITVMQAITGAMIARGMGESPLLGLMAGNVSLMGGFGTAAGFAADFEQAGLKGAATVGLAAAAFGVIAGGVVAGLVGGRLVEGRLHRKAKAAGPATTEVEAAAASGGFIAEVVALVHSGRSTWVHLVVLLGCMKLGAFVSLYLQRAGITFPVYMGSMLVAALLRNAHDLRRGQWLQNAQTDAIGSVALTWLLAVVMIDLQLNQLAHAALPMLVILAIQVVLLGALAYWVVFRVMGRDYEAAMMSAGMIGFGLGATSNALASMRVLAGRFGAAPRAFLIVPIVGAFLIDFVNALVTTTALNLLR
jgi:ESS family glutamate:Na+ symporter